MPGGQSSEEAVEGTEADEAAEEDQPGCQSSEHEDEGTETDEDAESVEDKTQ